MLLAGLHAASRNGPCFGCKIDFIPRSAQRLAGSCRAEDRELQRLCRDVVSLTQLGHEGRYLDVGHRLVMIDLRYFADGGEHLLQVPTPPRRIITGPETTHRCPRQHTLNAATSAGSSFGF